MMEEYYYITPDNQRGGPVLPEKFAEKGITVDTLVWKRGMSDWQPAGKLDEVKDYVLPSHQASASGSNEQELSTTPNFAVGGKYYLPKPDNYMVWAILSTVCCCLPLGIVAIIKASKVNTLYYTGQYEEAVLQADSARNWATWAAVAGIIFSFLNGMLNYAFGAF